MKGKTEATHWGCRKSAALDRGDYSATTISRTGTPSLYRPIYTRCCGVLPSASARRRPWKAEDPIVSPELRTGPTSSDSVRDANEGPLALFQVSRWFIAPF